MLEITVFRKRIILIMVFLPLWFVSSCQQGIAINFLETEWMSDSLVDGQVDHGREFVFFDSIANFTRTSWWSTEYILDTGTLTGDRIRSQTQDNYTIQIIDSFQIRVFNDSYDGYFTGNPWTKDEYLYKSLERFTEGNMAKVAVLGEWKFDSCFIDFEEGFSPERFPDHVERKLAQVAGLKVRDKPVVRFGLDNLCVVSDSEGHEIRYSYIIDGDEISLFKSDYVITMEYKLNGNHLTFFNQSNQGRAHVEMKRE